MEPVLVFNVGSNVIKYYRDNNGRLIKELDNSFFPYFYVEDEHGKFTAIDGRKVKRVAERSPKNIPVARERY